MKLKIEIPETLEEIKLKDYKHFLKFQDENVDDRFYKAKMIEIFCGANLKDVLQMRYADTEEVIMVLEKLFEQKPKLVQKFSLNGVEYGFHPSLDELTLGEYIDLDKNIGDWDNIEKAMNVLYRPIDAKFKHKYSIADYKVGNAGNLLDMPLSAVMSSIFFLLNLGIDLSTTMMRYLEKGAVHQDLIQVLNSEVNGDGIYQFRNSLTTILRNLNISLN